MDGSSLFFSGLLFKMVCGFNLVCNWLFVMMKCWFCWCFVMCWFGLGFFLFGELVFGVDCCLVFVVGGGDCLLIDWVYDVVGGEDVFDVCCCCWVFDFEIVDVVVVEYVLEEICVWMMVDGDENVLVGYFVVFIGLCVFECDVGDVVFFVVVDVGDDWVLLLSDFFVFLCVFLYDVWGV